MTTVEAFIEATLRNGQHHFTTQEAVVGTGSNQSAVVRALARLVAKGVLAKPQRGFYVAVPPEYHRLGCLPAEQFVPQLMAEMGEPYHVALLSAAVYHGAAHQRPQRFQVMVSRPRAPILCGEVAVDFHVRRDLEHASVVTMNTPRGHMSVSSPETTALELVGYAPSAGGLDNVATVLSELAEVVDASRLAVDATGVPLAWVQRLGWLLELVEAEGAAKVLEPLVRSRAKRVAPLDPSVPRTGAPRSVRWRLALNIEVEPDL
jgi:predicted transcriptional regulator of viral defense system